MNAIYLIPARGGPKGIPAKNIKELNGKPLTYYAIDTTRGLADDVDICISTDNDKIIDAVENYSLKVQFKRLAKLANDQAGMSDVLLHAVKHYSSKGINDDCIILLQPTWPLRSSTCVKKALGLYSPGLDMVVSVKETCSSPYYVLFEDNEEGYLEVF